MKLREKIIKPGEKPNIPMVMGAALISGSAGRYINLSQHLSKDKCSFLNIN